MTDRPYEVYIKIDKTNSTLCVGRFKTIGHAKANITRMAKRHFKTTEIGEWQTDLDGRCAKVYAINENERYLFGYIKEVFNN